MVRRTIASITVGLVSIGLVLGLGTPDLYGMVSYAQSAPALKDGCAPNVVPVGQANPPGSQLEPLAPIWCFDLAAPGQPTRKTGANDWLDGFETVTQMGRFADGDYDYRVFSNVQSQKGFQSMHFTNNQHWMDDNAGGGQGGTMIRPNRSFTFENGKLVVEQDVAANLTGYGGDAWTEIEISNQPGPTGVTWDNLYAYGQFGAPGSWTIGCRLTNPICSVESPTQIPDVKVAGSKANCFETAPHRLMEVSFFEQCGSVHEGGVPEAHARQCNSAAQAPDMLCRDRFRIELTASGLKYFINGFLYFEDSDWPANRQIDPNAIANGQWYVYASDWQDTHPSPAYRFHWTNFVVNPHTPDGTFRAPSTAPNFCLGQLGNTCMPGMAVAPVPTITPAATTTTE